MKLSFAKTVFSKLFNYSIDPLSGLSSKFTLESLITIASSIELSYFTGRNCSDFRESFSYDNNFDVFKSNIKSRNMPISYILYVSCCVIATDPELRNIFWEIVGHSGKCPNFIYSVLSNIRANTIFGLVLKPRLDSKFLDFINKYAKNSIWDIEYLRFNRDVLRSVIILMMSDGLIDVYGCCAKEFVHLPFNVNGVSKISSLDVKEKEDGCLIVTAMPYSTIEHKERTPIDEKSLSYAVLFNIKIFDHSGNRLDYTTFSNGVVCEVNPHLLIDVVIDICRNGNPGNSNNTIPNEEETTKNNFVSHPLGKLKFRKYKEVLLDPVNKFISINDYKLAGKYLDALRVMFYKL